VRAAKGGQTARCGTSAARGGGDCHADESAKTLSASQVRKREPRPNIRGPYRKDLGPGRYRRRDTPDTPLDRCCNTGPAKHYPGSRKEREGLAM